MTHLDVTQALCAVEAAIAGRAASQEIPAPQTLDNPDWPPDYGAVLAWRQQQVALFEQDPDYLESARAYYGLMEPQSCIDWINGWCDIYEPRNVGKPGRRVRSPMILFRRQDDLIRFFFACMEADASGLVDKSRDMGATWCGLSFSHWLWTFHDGATIGWGSNHLEQVDKLGEPDTIFEKLRAQIRLAPAYFRQRSTAEPPKVIIDGEHLKHGICINPENGAVIRGQGGKNIGRGGRSRVYFVDEAAHLEHPEAVEASLSENTRCRIDMSSAGPPGTVFDRTREAGVPWEVGAPVIRDRANVFVMDWSDHPEKTRAWYAGRRSYYESKGMPQVVAREIDRNPMGAQEGIIIAHEWALAAVDAHLKLGFDDAGGWWGGLDVADEGADANALVRGRGLVVKYAEEWGERDPGVTARRAFRACRDTAPITLQYDCIGLGTNVKSEFNRLMDDAVDVSWLKLSPWNAGGKVHDPGLPVIKGDSKSPTNKNYFENFKAQAWWRVAQMFYKTWRAVQAAEGNPVEGEVDYEAGELISIDSRTIPPATLAKLLRELSQATMGQSSRLKLLVNKAPDGTRSPNLADGLIMGRVPARQAAETHAGLFGPKIFS